MATIKPEQKTHTKNYGKIPVEKFWLKISAETVAEVATKTSDSQVVDLHKMLNDFLSNTEANSVVCVFSEELSSGELCKNLANVRDNGSRVYILTNGFHDEMKNLSGCLMRYGGSTRLGSFILKNPNSSNPSGYFFTGRFNGGSLATPTNLLLGLDATQCAVLFRYFCWQFWNKTVEEFVENKPIPTEDAPLDIYPPKDDGCDLEHLKKVWTVEAENCHVNTSRLEKSPYLKFTNFSNSNIVSLFTAMDNDLVSSISEKNNEIFAIDDTAFLNSVKTHEGTWLIPKISTTPPGEELYALQLNDSQKNILEKHAEELKSKKPLYQYCKFGLRENLNGKTICKLGEELSKKYAIAAKTTQKLDVSKAEELLPKEEFDNVKPHFDDDGKSVSIEYQWTNKPFTLPPGSTKHSLYENWEDAIKNIQNFIGGIEKAIAENEEKEKTFSKRLKSLFLGKQQKSAEYRKDLKDLRDTDFARLEEAEIRTKIEQINGIRKSVENDSGEIVEENRKAKLADDIENENSKKEELEKQLHDEEKKLQTTEESIQLVKNSQQELKGLNAKKETLDGDITRLTKEIESLPKDENEDSKNKKEELEKELTNKKEELQSVEGKVQSAQASKKELDNLNVQKSKLTVDISKLKNQIQSHTSRIQNFEAQLRQMSKEKKPEEKKGSILEVTQKNTGKPAGGALPQTLPVPALDRLPETGELYQQSGQSFLAITNWEDYDNGKKEATRLQAKLCAKGE
ncbi:MAG: hypothetical protein FWG66_15635 [Spirochaetes bacterium]|nr:hypothetical protein [Spirochaetota bacterium]